jgi:hypothetical protein
VEDLELRGEFAAKILVDVRKVKELVPVDIEDKDQVQLQEEGKRNEQQQPRNYEASRPYL